MRVFTKVLIYAAVVTVAFVIDSKVVLLGVRPDLVALLAYGAGLKYGPKKGIVFGSLLGLVSDSISGGLLGPGLLGKGMTGYLASLFSGGLFRWSPLFGLCGAGFLTFLDRAFSFTAVSVFDVMPAGGLHALGMMVAPAALNSIGGVFIRPAER